MADKKSWDEFRNTGLILFVNQFLHIFGWAIVLERDKENVVNAYPARVKFRGFGHKVTDDAHLKLATFLKENVDELFEEAHTKSYEEQEVK